MSVKSRLKLTALGPSAAVQFRHVAASVAWKTPVAIVLTIIFWASAFTGIRVALAAYAPEQIAFLRYVIASVILLVYSLLSRMPLPHLQDIPLLALRFHHLQHHSEYG